MTCEQVRPRLGEFLVYALDDADSEAILEHVLAPQWLDEVDLLRQALSE